MAKKRSIIISHLSKEITAEDLKKVFTEIGRIKYIKFRGNKHKKAILKFSHKDAVYRAIHDFNGLKMHGRRIKIRKYRSKKRSHHEKQKSKDENDSRHSGRRHASHHGRSRHHSFRDHRSRSRTSEADNITSSKAGKHHESYHSSDCKIRSTFPDINNNDASSYDQKTHRSRTENNMHQKHQDRPFRDYNTQAPKYSNFSKQNHDSCSSLRYENHTSNRDIFNSNSDGSQSSRDQKTRSSNHVTYQSKTENNMRHKHQDCSFRGYNAHDQNPNTNEQSLNRQLRHQENQSPNNNINSKTHDNSLVTEVPNNHRYFTSRDLTYSNTKKSNLSRDAQKRLLEQLGRFKSYLTQSDNVQGTQSSKHEFRHSKINTDIRRDHKYYSSRDLNYSNINQQKSFNRDYRPLQSSENSTSKPIELDSQSSESESSESQKPSSSKPGRINGNKPPPKFDDADRTFPRKVRNKPGKKARRRMFLSGQPYEEEKKWPSTEWIEYVVKHKGKKW